MSSPQPPSKSPGPPPETRLQQAHLLCLRGDLPRAQALLEDLLARAQPPDAEARRLLEQIHARQAGSVTVARGRPGWVDFGIKLLGGLLVFPALGAILFGVSLLFHTPGAVFPGAAWFGSLIVGAAPALRPMLGFVLVGAGVGLMICLWRQGLLEGWGDGNPDFGPESVGGDGPNVDFWANSGG